MNLLIAVLAGFCLLMSPSAQAKPASAPTATGPELAKMGNYPVGVMETRAGDDGRAVRVMIWYPAAAPGQAMRYAGALPSLTGGAAIPFTTEAFATRDAAFAPGKFPTLIFSHGFGSRPERQAWLSENLASKGYIVIAPDHADRPLAQQGALGEAIVLRSQDIVSAGRMALAQAPSRDHIDARRIGLIGYSMGGNGVLRVSGAAFNKAGAPARLIANGALDPLLEGGALDRGPLLANIQAAVLIAPWGGQSSISAFSPKSLARVATPTLILGGDRDEISGYADGIASIYNGMTSAPRALVTFENAGHTIAADTLPPEGDGVFAYEEFFEDPVWRKERLHAISQHFITAFLDLHVKGDQARAPYLALPNGRSADGVWPLPPGTPSTGAYAAAQPGVTIWRGFQRRWAEGLRFQSDTPAKP